MNRRHALKAIAGLALCPLCSTTGVAAEGIHWGYEGAHGPGHWGELNPASKVCAIGSQQSPIDIADSVKADLPPLNIGWDRPPENVVNNGHTIQINFQAGHNTLAIGKDAYALLQLHFHRPSEHRLNGKPYPMEAHFVHANTAGVLAVIGVLMTTGKSNPTFSTIVETMPEKKGVTVKAAAAIDPNQLLPAERGYFRYEGSLTTPPCSETVNWLLLKNPIEVAEADVATFAKLYAMNARPVQKINRRFVLQSG